MNHLDIESVETTSTQGFVYLKNLDEPIVVDLEKEYDFFDAPNGREEPREVVTGFANPRFWGCPVLLSEESEKEIAKLL